RDFHVTGVQTCALPISGDAHLAFSATDAISSRPVSLSIWARRARTGSFPDSLHASSKKDSCANTCAAGGRPNVALSTVRPGEGGAKHACLPKFASFTLD